MTTSERYLMALDFGTGAGRCVLTDINGQRTHTGYFEWAFDAPADAQPGGFSFDPDRFWTILGQAAQQAMRRGNVRPDQIVGVSATSVRQGFVLLDAAGKEIWAVPNRDVRGFREAPEAGARWGQRMNDLSGHWPSWIMAPTRVLWLRRHQPDVLERARTLLMINDWMLYRLCGEMACEPTNAPETCLYDIARHEWNDELINACGLRRGMFPATLAGGSLLGRVTARAALETGLLAGTPVVVGGADTECGVLGSGALNEGETVIVAGTSTPTQMVLLSPIIDRQARTWSAPHVPSQRWVLESNMGASGSVQRWFRDSFCQEEMRLAAETGKDAFVLMTQEAQQSPIGSAGVVCVTGFRIMNARGAGAPQISGFVLTNERAMIPEGNSKKHFLRAMLESHAFAARGNIDQLIEISGVQPSAVAICGGWANSEFWAQMVADVLNRPIRRPAVAEATAMGTAVCAGVGAGVYADLEQGVSTLIHMRPELTPDARRHGEYDLPYRTWRTLRDVVLPEPRA
jgi:sugar (pentulose or hexulose) kinase